MVARTLDTTDMRLDVDFNAGRCCGARQEPEGFPTAGAALLRRAQVADVVDDRERGTGPTAGPRPAGLLSTLVGARGWGGAGLIGPRRFFAFRPGQALCEVAKRGLMGFYCRLQGGFPLQQLLVLRRPVVRLPCQFNIGLFRQHHRLLGKGGRARAQARKGMSLVAGCLPYLLYTSFFWQVPFFLKGTVG